MQVLFTNGALFDGHRHLGRGAVLVRDGRVVWIIPDDAGAVGGVEATITSEADASATPEAAPEAQQAPQVDFTK